MKGYTKYLIIGNGPAGTAAAGKIRQLDKEGSITILSRELYPYYARPRLPELVRGDLDPGQLTVFKPDWYGSRAIELQLKTRVTGMDTASRTVTTATGEIEYGKLLLSTGAAPFFPPIEGAVESGALALRTIEDALAIREAAAKTREVILIGGGLLGLELADHLADGKRLIRVIEFLDSLLPNHLSQEKGRTLQQLLEARGFHFHLRTRSERMWRDGDGVVILTDDGQEIRGGMVILSAGVRARISLASEAGVAVKKGILVDSHLQTSVPGVYAAGDCIELDGRLWGFVKSAMEQGRVAGENMASGNPLAYSGTDIDVRLKVSDIGLNDLG